MSLRDQFLRAGLVNEKQAKKAEKDVRKEQRKQQNQPQQGTMAVDAQRAHSEKVARDQALNRERAERAKQKEVAAQIRQLIQANRVAVGDGEIPYHFTDPPHVKRLLVTAALRDRIADGRLAIVKLDGQYELVPAEIAARIRERDVSCIILHHGADAKAQENPQDDPYADHPIPDDLIW